MDLGLLILRLVVGALFIGHGTQKLFGSFGGHGPAGTAGILQGLGFRPAGPLAILNGLAEVGGGLLLAFGLLTPFGAAAIIGVMLAAIVSAHARHGIWNQHGGVEFPVTNIAVALALAFVGPGDWSLDAALGWDLQGLSYGFGALALGVIAALVVLSTRRRAEAGQGGPVPGSTTA